MSDDEFRIEDYITENYTFTKDSIIEGELESTITYEFNEKNHVIDVLNSMLLFLKASGYEYIDKLVAVKSSGEQVSNEDNMSEDIEEILTRIVVDLEGVKHKKTEAAPSHLKVVSINDNEDNTDSAD
tara:strand:- start:1615 stop:1995 length:381 start_codon:yes stop_codon:yes gene_type:complete